MEPTIALNLNWTIISGLAAGLATCFGYCISLTRFATKIEGEVKNLKQDLSDTKETHKEKTLLLFAKVDAIQTSVNNMMTLLGELKGRLDSMERLKRD